MEGAVSQSPLGGIFRPSATRVLAEGAKRHGVKLTNKQGPRGGGGMPAVPLSQIATHEGNGARRLKPDANAWVEK